MLFVQWLRYGSSVCETDPLARSDCMHTRLLIAYNTTTLPQPKEWQWGGEGERKRGWEGKGGERGEGGIHICSEHVRTHTYPFAALWCTVEREYKRLKAKRKQTGSSLSKPNSEGVKLRHAAVGSPSKRARKLSFLCFPLYFRITFLTRR